MAGEFLETILLNKQISSKSRGTSQTLRNIHNSQRSAFQVFFLLLLFSFLILCYVFCLLNVILKRLCGFISIYCSIYLYKPNLALSTAISRGGSSKPSSTSTLCAILTLTILLALFISFRFVTPSNSTVTSESIE